MVSIDAHNALSSKVDRMEAYLTTDTEEQTSVATLIKPIQETVNKQGEMLNTCLAGSTSMHQEVEALKQHKHIVDSNISQLHGKVDVVTGTGMIRGQGRDLLECKPVNGLPVFSGKEGTLHFKEWSYKLHNIMEQLKPGSRDILEAIDITKELDWTPEVHNATFASDESKK